MFPGSAFSSVPSQTEDLRANASSETVSQVADKTRLSNHQSIPDQIPIAAAQYAHLVSPVSYASR